MNQADAVNFVLMAEGAPRRLDTAGYGGLDLVSELALNGVRARIDLAGPADLLGVAFPVVLGRRGGGWLVALGAAREWVEVIDGGSPTRMPLAEFETAFNGQVVNIQRRFNWRSGVFSAAAKLALRHPRLVVPVGLLTIAAQAVGIATAAVIGGIADKAHVMGGRLIFMSIMAIVAISALQVGIGWIRKRMTTCLGANVKMALASDFFAKFLRLPFPVANNKSAGDVAFALNATRRHASVIMGVITTHWFDAANILVGFAVVTAFSPRMGFVMLLFSALTFGFNMFAVHSQTADMDALNEASSAYSSCLSEILEGIATVKAQGIEALVTDRWTAKLRSEVARSQNLTVRGIRLGAVSSALNKAASVAILAGTACLVVSGVMGLGTMLLAIQVTMTYMGSVMSLAEALPRALRETKMGVKRVLDIIETAPEKDVVLPERAIVGAATMRDVWFKYPGSDRWVITGLNLSVDPGGREWLNTPSGTGKTTILRLLAGLLEPTSGEVCIDGERPELSRLGIVYLPQFVKMFSGSLMSNLKTFSGCHDYERIIEYAKMTGLHDGFIKSLPMGYETLTQFGGGNISGGQRQLVAITAALASDRKILLMDEAMANLDWPIRARIAQLEALKGRTIIYASHDKFI
jgi:ABC-type bacteriocin/lantibiotic exporter with double-glycine peptidase domain